MSGAGDPVRRVTDARPVVRLGVTHVSRLLPETGFGDPGGVAPSLESATFLVDLPGEEVLVLPAAEVSVLARSGGRELNDRTIAVATARRQERQRIERRSRNADWLMAFIDELESAARPDDAYRALSTCAAHVTGAPAAVVYTADTKAGALRPVRQADQASLPTLPADALRDLAPMRVVSRITAPRNAAPGDQPMAPVLTAFGAAQLLCVTVTPSAILIVVERRRDRVFTTDERDIVGWIVRRTERHLR